MVEKIIHYHIDYEKNFRRREDGIQTSVLVTDYMFDKIEYRKQRKRNKLVKYLTVIGLVSYLFYLTDIYIKSSDKVQKLKTTTHTINKGLESKLNHKN